jgi:hypothetical protein
MSTSHGVKSRGWNFDVEPPVNSRHPERNQTVTSQDERHRRLPPEASTFGIPEHIHPVSPWVLWLCWLVALAALGPAAMAFYFLWKPFGANPPPREVMVIGGAAFVVGSLVLIGMALWVRTLVYLVFADALVRVRSGRWTIFRWDDIREVFEKPIGADSRYLIVLSDGRTKSIASIVKNHKALGDTIVARVTERVMPGALRTFEKGGTVSFGPLSVSPDLLTYKNKQVAWGQVTRLDVEFNPQMKSTQLEVRAGGGFLTWCSVPVQNIPNLRVFLELAYRACPAYGQQGKY